MCKTLRGLLSVMRKKTYRRVIQLKLKINRTKTFNPIVIQLSCLVSTTVFSEVNPLSYPKNYVRKKHFSTFIFIFTLIHFQHFKTIWIIYYNFFSIHKITNFQWKLTNCFEIFRLKNKKIRTRTNDNETHELDVEHSLNELFSTTSLFNVSIFSLFFVSVGYILFVSLSFLCFAFFSNWNFLLDAHFSQTFNYFWITLKQQKNLHENPQSFRYTFENYSSRATRKLENIENMENC